MELQELKDTWESYHKNKQDENKHKLVEHYYLFVKKIAKTLSQKLNYKVNEDELASYGVDGLYKAIDRFDESRGYKFETYAYSRIKGSMLDALRKDDWVPRCVRIRQNAIETEKNKLESNCGCYVPIDVVLDEMGLDKEDYMKNNAKFCAKTFSSIDTTSFSDVDDENQLDFNINLACKTEASPDAAMIRKEFLDKLMGKNFTENERKIIYYYYYESLTMKDIADKLCMSEPRISQIHQNILARLKKRIKVNPSYFGDDLFDILSTYDGCVEL
jgi:RNA polymerase sigma factor for flagellar operon FliA